MNALKVVGIVLGVLIVLVLGVGLLLPTEYAVERKMTMKTKRDCPYQQVANLKNSEVWSPWKNRDPSMVWTFGEVTEGEGASYTWTSENSGDGSYRITKVDPGKRVETYIDFGTMGTSEGYWTFERDGEFTIVTWGFEGEAQGIVDRYFTLFMDSMVGPDFEEGLSRIKQVCEI